MSLPAGTGADDLRVEAAAFDLLEDYFGDDRARRRPRASLVRELRMDGDDVAELIVALQEALDVDLPNEAWEAVDAPEDVVAALKAHRAPLPPGVARRPRWFPDGLFPFESREVLVEGCALHYLDEGRGPTLLLLHGNPTWSFLYRGVVSALRDRFRCVAVDYPGFGLSVAPPGYDFRPASHARVVERFVEALGLEDLTLMVQDWGGPIGLAMAGRRPERVRALVIGNTWAWPVEGDRHFEWFSRLLGGPVGRVAVRRLNAFVNLVLPAGVRGGRLTAEVMAAYRAPFRLPHRRLPTHVFPREILKSRAFLAGVESGLRHLAHLPALILWGARDVAFRAQERWRFEEAFPRHRTVVLEGAGHYIQEDAPTEIAQAIRRWWPEEVERR